MKMFTVTPKPEFSNSHRWVADEEGLKHIKKHYAESYKDIPTYFIDRFVVEDCKKFGIDFGGMCKVNEPTITINVEGIEIEIVKWHLETYGVVLKMKDCMRSDGTWSAKVWHVRHAYGNETRNMILDEVNKAIKIIEAERALDNH